jgi:hypothetical protein
MGLFGRVVFVSGLLLCVLILLYLSGVWLDVSMSLPKAPAPRVLAVVPLPVDTVDTKEESSPCASDHGSLRFPIRTTVCDVVQHPNKYTCSRIRFRATLLTDCIHGAILESRRCERGIVPGNGPSRPAVDAFFDDACAGRPIRFDETRTATFTGQLRLRSRESHSTACVLDIEDIENVTITRPAPHVTRDPPPPLPEPPVINVVPDAVPILPD